MREGLLCFLRRVGSLRRDVLQAERTDLLLLQPFVDAMPVEDVRTG